MNLPELSAAAAQGEWRGYRTLLGPGTAIRASEDVTADTIALVGPDKDAAFIVALVNAYRTGQLVPHDAVAPIIYYHASSGHEGDASAEAIVRAMAALGEPPAWVAAVPELATALTAINGGCDHAD